MKLVVVMATYNGAPYIEQQIDSIIGGTIVPDRLIIRDDLSNDGTVEIVSEAAKSCSIEIDFKPNPNRFGVTKNFLSLLTHVPDGTDFVAFSDQDDIWEPFKLQRALETLQTCNTDIPALFCSRQQLIDQSGKPIRLSPANRAGPSFANALVENIVSGCTSVINRKALNMVRNLPIPEVSFHDWWLYLLVTGHGGKVIFDSKPGILYRQHSANVAGSPLSFTQNLKGRLRRQFSGQSRQLIDKNTAALLKERALLTPENSRKLNAFEAARQGNIGQRLKYIMQSDVHRQTKTDSAIMRALWVAGRI